MDTQIFKVLLDPDLIESFDETIRAEEHITTTKVFTSKRYHDTNAWDCICSCVERIRSTVQYLNNLELGSMHGYGCAFDFIDFMNNASVLISCVDMLAQIFSLNLNSANNASNIFNETGFNGSGNDKKYFEFLRSLCVVHPVDTSRHNEYHRSEFVTCPHIYWTDSISRMLHDDWDLCATVYTNDSFYNGETIGINISQIFEYVEFRYSLLDQIQEGLIAYQNEIIQNFMQNPVSAKTDDETDKEYVQRLKTEDIERFGDYDYYIFDFLLCDLLNFDPTNHKNAPAVERYKNTWMYALELERNAMNNMNHEGKENSGVETRDGWTLFENLLDPDADSEFFKKYDYQIEKMDYLDGRHGYRDSNWGRQKLFEMKGDFPDSIIIDEELGDMELYILGLTALFEIATEAPGLLNDAVPNDSRYRRIPSEG